MPSKARIKQLTNILDDTDKITKSIQAGINRALLQHKRLGFPIYVWENGQVVRIPPEKIPVQDVK